MKSRPFMQRKKTRSGRTLAAVGLTLFSLLGIAEMTGYTHLTRMSGLSASEREGADRAVLEQTLTLPAPQAAPEAQSLLEQPDRVIDHGPDPGLVHPAPPVRSRSDATLLPRSDACPHCGKVAAINLVKLNGAARDLHAYVGGIADGVVGSEINSDDGNVLMTILGAGRGAYAGHSLEERVRPQLSYLVKVQMKDGSKRTVMMADKPSFDVGDRVKLINGGVSVIS